MHRWQITVGFAGPFLGVRSAPVASGFRNTPMTEPRLSVVMPVFNGAVWLQKAIELVLQQSFSDFEFIIVDDASTDASKQIAMEAARIDSRIRRIDQRHMGVAAALNRGVALARSPWIARMDADDIANPARFQQQITF